MRFIHCFEAVAAILLVSMTIAQTKDDHHKKCPECPMNATSSVCMDDQLADLFPGLFVSNETIAHVEDVSGVVRDSEKVRKLPKPKNSQSSSVRKQRDVSPCCETTEYVVKPLTVLYEGNTFTVVHLSSESQFITTSECTTPDATCNVGKTCTQLYGSTWVLVFDPFITEYYPPVKFVPVLFQEGCECV